MKSEDIEIIEVGPRDGFQSIPQFISTSDKVRIIGNLVNAGISRIETTSVVSERAVPQLADAEAIIMATKAFAGCSSQVLVPNARRGQQALDMGATKLCFVISASETHNFKNVRQSISGSLAEYDALSSIHPDSSTMRVNLATAFDCPYEGSISEKCVSGIVEHLVSTPHQIELAICDTTGRCSPLLVSSLFTFLSSEFGDICSWVFHGHDTYGMGIANCFAAWETGIRKFDASIAGLGGCPFAPGATGNVATEDLAWMFEKMFLNTGIDLDQVLQVAKEVSRIPGSQTGGRVRDALSGQ